MSHKNFPLWTHHPSSFRIDDPNLKVDPTQSTYWKTICGVGYRYSEIAPQLWERLGTNQFLWCCLTRGQFKRSSESLDIVEWELVITQDKVTFLNQDVWENLIRSRTHSWENLFVKDPAAFDPTKLIGLVKTPLKQGEAICHDQLPTGNRARH